MSFDSLPHDLKVLDQWVMWKLEESGVQDKLTKIPYMVNDTKAVTTDPATWNSFKVCVDIFNNSRDFSGIGFVFSYYDEFVGYDIDGVRNPETGEIDSEIMEEVKSLNSYTEISQSGRGLHVIFKGKKPGTCCKSHPREMYDKDRFFVMTGDHLEGTPLTINQPPPEIIKAIYDKIDTPRKVTETSRKGVMENCTLEDKEIVALVMGARNASKFEALWDGDTSAYGGDDSAADQALCNILAFYTQDEAQIDRLFRESGLYRNKWEREDYRGRTIKKAIESLGPADRYTPSRKEITEEVEETDDVDPVIKEVAERISYQ